MGKIDCPREQLFGGDHRSDNQRDNQRDNLKPLVNKESDQGDNPKQMNKEDKRVKSRLKLSARQLVEFLKYLEQQ